jgi:hypothetical protein
MEAKMKELVVAIAFLIAAMSTAFAQRQVNTDVPYNFGTQRYAYSDVYYDFAPGARAHIIKVNAPGGAYIQCDGPGAPVRCTADGW